MRWVLLFSPGAERLSDRDNLAQVIRIVVSHKQNFTKVRPAFTVWYFSGQIDTGVPDQGDDLFQVRIKAGDGRLPTLIRNLNLGPESIRKFRRFPFRVQRIPQYISLTNPHVLQLSPYRVGPAYPRISELWIKVGQRLVQGQMSLPAIQQFHELLSQNRIIHFQTSSAIQSALIKASSITTVSFAECAPG